MHVRGVSIRRVISILGAVAVTGGLVTTLTSASATTSRAAATTTTIALRGSVAGGIKITGSGDTVTFVFDGDNANPLTFNLSNGQATFDPVATFGQPLSVGTHTVDVTFNGQRIGALGPVGQAVDREFTR